MLQSYHRTTGFRLNWPLRMARHPLHSNVVHQSAGAQDTSRYGDLPEIAFEEYTLENGLHVILHQDRSTPIVAVGVMYHVGSKNDEPHRRGFAHFFEHLLFEGSKHIGRGEFSRHVERAGGQLNANTSCDRTYYYELLPSNQLALGLWLESERMLHARVDQKGVDTQREVVKEEWRQNYQNRPYGSILPEVLRRAYSDHPYQWPVIGHMEDLAAAGEEDYRAFYERYYVPNNAVLVVAGDLDPKGTMDLVHRYFGSIPRGATVAHPPMPFATIDGEVRDVVLDQIELPAVVHAYRIPPATDAGFPAVDLVSRALSAGNSARLQRALKDRHGLAVQVGAFTLPFEQGGIAVLFAIANAGVAPDVLGRAMDEEVDRVRQETISPGEMDRVRAQLKTASVMELTRVAGIAHQLATAHTLMGGASWVRDDLRRSLVVSAEDVRAAAGSWFDPTRRVVLHYLPNSTARS